jgi:biotin transporter BioY
MVATALPRGPLVDIAVPGVAPAPAAAAPRHGLPRDFALISGGLLLVALCLWLDAHYILHGPALLFGGALDARTPPADAILASASVALVALGARVGIRALARDGALVVGGVLLLALGAQVAIPLKPVPITGQTFAVLLLAAALGWRRAFAAVVLYIVLGTAGLPVFADVSSAVTYGSLAGFVLAALVVGFVAELGWDRRLLSAIAAMLLGEVLIYAGGLPWLASFIGWERAFDFGLKPFLIGDILKLLSAALLLPGAWYLTGRAARRGASQ